MDYIKVLAIIGPIATSLAGGGATIAYQGWTAEEGKFARAAAKYRAAKDLGRACMGDEAFDAEWAQVLADLREAEGRE